MVSWAGMESVTETQEPTRVVGGAGRFFYSYIFYFRFLQKIYFRFGNLQKYTPAARLPAAGTWTPGRGTVGFFVKKISRRKLCPGPWRPVAWQPGGRPPRPPGSRAAGPGRSAAGRPALPPLYKGWLVPRPLICITKIPETKKKERGREIGEALPDFRAADCR